MTGKNEPLRSLGIVCSTSRHESPTTGPRTVDVGGGGLAALIASSTDLLARFGFDQLLHDHSDRLADQIHAVAGTEHLE
jgi:hypothetical protein